MIWLKSPVLKVQKFTNLSRAEKMLLLQAFLWMLPVALCLQICGLSRTQRFLINLCPQACTPSDALLPQVKQTAEMMAIAAWYNRFWINCLKKSVVLWFLLRRQGIVSDLRIGVRRQLGIFQAHAWVEFQGLVLNDTQDVRSRFAMFENPINVKV